MAAQGTFNELNLAINILIYRGVDMLLDFY